MDATVNPIMWLVADHLSPDLGDALGYDTDMRFLLPDLDFGEPDRIKILNAVEIIYESLREVPITVEIFRRAPLTDPGDSSESVSDATQAVQATEPGVFWGNASPAWDTARFATYKIFSARCDFDLIQGKSFSAGVKIACDLTPIRILTILFRFHQERTPWKESGTAFET